MKKIIKYEHECKRCAKTFISSFKKPKWCGKCKSASWETPRAIVMPPRPEDQARVA